MLPPDSGNILISSVPHLENRGGDRYFSKNLCSIAAVSPRVALPSGSNLPSPLPLRIPAPTAHCISASAQPPKSFLVFLRPPVGDVSVFVILRTAGIKSVSQLMADYGTYAAEVFFI